MRSIDVANRKWRIECQATPAFLAARNRSYAWTYLGSGLTLTVLACGYVWLIMLSAVRNRRLNEESAAANQVLKTEVSQRKDVEKRLLHYTAELEDRNEEVKRFAYVVSHDLRAPLVNLKGFAGELSSAMKVVESGIEAAIPSLEGHLRAELGVAVKEDIPEALGFINSSVERMDGFINALLKLSRIGHRKLIPERVNMMELASDTVSTLAHQIEERSAEVVVEDIPDVIADAVAMRQVVGNLLTNAVLYLDPARPGRIVVSGTRNGSETVISVRDNGRGIAPDNMDNVFAPFRRAGAANVPGEGMGLAYVQAVLRRHGGRIACESVPDVGTTFTFTIPDQLMEASRNE